MLVDKTIEDHTGIQTVRALNEAALRKRARLAGPWLHNASLFKSRGPTEGFR